MLSWVGLERLLRKGDKVTLSKDWRSGRVTQVKTWRKSSPGRGTTESGRSYGGKEHGGGAGTEHGERLEVKGREVCVGLCGHYKDFGFYSEMGC